MTAEAARRVPAAAGESEYEEKRSRFLGHVRPVETEEEARAFIAEIKKRHYDARHNCWCYIINNGPERYSDDAEPQGTAGLPMLEVFRREQVTGVVCVVTRYFGGVLLGAGGLLRAYTRAAKDALDNAGTAVLRPWITAQLRCRYNHFERIKNELAAAGGILGEVVYDEGVTISLSVPEGAENAFFEAVGEISAGTADCLIIGKTER